MRWLESRQILQGLGMGEGIVAMCRASTSPHEKKVMESSCDERGHQYKMRVLTYLMFMANRDFHPV